MCGLRVRNETNFAKAPPLLALEFSRCNIEIDHSLKINVHGDFHRYDLAGVVYFKPGESHFVSNIVMEDNQVWYYDGLINGGIQDHLEQIQLCLVIVEADQLCWHFTSKT